MKLHLPLMLRAALLVCMTPSSFATELVVLPADATSTDTAQAKLTLASPTLGDDASYQLSLSNSSSGTLSLPKYIYNEEGQSLDSYTYELTFQQLGSTGGQSKTVTIASATQGSITVEVGFSTGDDVRLDSGTSSLVERSFIGVVYTGSDEYSLSIYGGTFYNDNDRSAVNGDFIANSIISTSGGTAGAALYNTSNTTLSSLTGNFIGNSISSKGESLGGAIANRGIISTITGDFILNQIASISTESNAFGGAIYNDGKINSISGDFIANYITSYSTVAGGAIYIANSGTVSQITGSFSSNSISSTDGAAYGGALAYGSYSNASSSIVADFANNSASSSTNNALGGALYLSTTSGGIQSLTGNFIKNSVSSLSANAFGGAIYNASTLSLVDASFIENSAQVGGAIYNVGTLTIQAVSSDSIFQDNTATEGAAIYNSAGASLSLLAQNSYSIIFNDSISNEGSITMGSSNSTGTVVLNSSLIQSTTGSLTLAGGTLLLASNADLSQASLSIEGGTISTADATITDIQINALDLNGSANLAIDIQFAGQEADILQASSTVDSTGNLMLSELYLIDAITDTTQSICIANEVLKSSIELADDISIIKSDDDTVDYSLFDITYNALDGTIKFSINSLKSSIILDIETKDYTMDGDEILSGSDLNLAGNSLYIEGNGHSIDMGDDSLSIEDNQTLTLDQVSSWTGNIDNEGTLELLVDDSTPLLIDGDINGDGLTAVSGNGSVSFLGDVEGDLSLSKDTILTGSLDLGGELQLDGTLNLSGDGSTEPYLSVGSITSSTGGFDIVLDDTVIAGLNFGSDGTTELISLETGFTESVSLAGGSSTIVDGTGLVELETSADGTSIQLVLADTSNFWMSDDGQWDAGDNDDWLKDVPTANDVATLTGLGTSDIELVGNQEVKTLLVDSSTQDYTLTGDQLSAGDLQIADGTLTIQNEVQVSGLTAIQPDAVLVVGSQGELTTGTLTLNADYQAGVSGFNNLGTTSITSTLNAAGYTINNVGTLNIKDGSVGAITGSGALNLTGTLTMDSDYSLSDATYTSTGTLNLGEHTATLTDKISQGGSIIADSVVITSNAGGSFNSITTNELEFVGLDTNSYILGLDDLNSLDGTEVTLNLLALDSNTADGTYKLIESTDATGLSSDGITLSQANIDTIVDLVINGGKDIYLDDSSGNLDLVITSDTDAPNGSRYIWDTSSDSAYSTKLAGIEFGPIVDSNSTITNYDILDFVDEVHVTDKQDIDLTKLSANDADGLLVSNLQGTTGSLLNIIGNGINDDRVTLYNTEATEAKNDVTVSATELRVDGVGGDASLSLASLSLSSAQLSVQTNGVLDVAVLTGDANSSIQGNLTITGSATGTSSYSGRYDDAQITVTGGSASFDISTAGAAELTLIAKGGAELSLQGIAGQQLESLSISAGASLTLEDVGASALTLLSDSSISSSSIYINPDASVIEQSFSQAGSPITVLTGAELTISNSTIYLGDSQTTASGLDISGITDQTVVELVILTDNASSSDELVSVVLGSTYEKYFADAQYVDGVIIATLNRNSYGDMGLTENGKAGLGIMGDVLIDINPQLDKNRDQYKDLANVLDSLDSYKQQGNHATADKLGAAIAGAGTTSLGSAAAADLERQLRSMKNRCDFIPLCHPSLDASSRYGAWISAEGGYSQLSNDGTAAGHEYNSWGGSMGYDAHVNELWRVGGALSLLSGDVSSDAADVVDGTLKNYYLSLYANRHVRAWNHNFVMTAGMLESSLDRSIATTNSTINTTGDSDGFNFAMSYQVGYKYNLRENGCFTLQPIASIALIHSSINGYTESNSSDAALKVGDQSMTYVTLSAGAQWDGLGGEFFINRSSRYSARLVVNANVGDKQSEADVSLVNSNGTTRTVTGAEISPISLEMGVGASIPVSINGNIFVDLSCEFSASMSEVSTGLGYRYNF